MSTERGPRPTEREIDDAVAGTFPASDPVALHLESPGASPPGRAAAPAPGEQKGRDCVADTSMRADDDRHEKLLAWLRDAHAMERSLESVLTTQARHAESVDRDLSERLRQHADETRRHAELVEAALTRHDADRSVVKDAAGRMQAAIQGMMTGGSSDTLVKDTLSGIAAEHFEIACYRSLETAARELGDTETAEMCRLILLDEESMASYLESQLADVTRKELASD